MTSPNPNDGPFPRIYIAGPFRADLPIGIERNVRRAEEFGLVVAEMGGVPLIPHTMYRFFQNALPDKFWLAAGKILLRPCDAIAVDVDRVGASLSDGTMGEIAAARAHNQPIFFDDERGTLRVWIANWIEAHSL
jgi:hypothetical protein